VLRATQADIQIMMKQKEEAKASAEHALWLADGMLRATYGNFFVSLELQFHCNGSWAY